MPVKTASVLAETERGREICAGNPQHTLPVASSGSISPQKCRDMRGRPLIYAFYGIIRAHISYGITGDRQSGEQMWCSRSFTPPAAAFRMTKGTLRRTKGRSRGQRDGQEDKGTVERTKGREELSFDIVFCAIGFIFRICQPALQVAEYFPFIPIVALPQHRLQFISCFTEPDMVLPV